MGEPLRQILNGRVRDEQLNIEDFAHLRQAQVILEDWRIEYNTYLPSTLGPERGLPRPARQTWTQQHQLKLPQ